MCAGFPGRSIWFPETEGTDNCEPSTMRVLGIDLTSITLKFTSYRVLILWTKQYSYYVYTVVTFYFYNSFPSSCLLSVLHLLL